MGQTMLGKTTYTTLFVSDQDRSLEFYTKVLGMTKLVDSAQPGGNRLSLRELPKPSTAPGGP